jgi:Transglutaminase-like superfamily
MRPAWSVQMSMFVHELGRRIRSMQLPQGTNACFEVASLGATVARDMGIDAKPMVGVWHSPIGEINPHAWLEVGGMVVHSRQRPTAAEIMLEALPVSDAFEPWRAA